MKKTIYKKLCLIFALSTSMAFAQNLVTNPGFGSSFTGWTRSGSTTMILNNQHSGSRAVRLGTKQSSVTQNIMSKLKVGNTYKFSAWAKIGSIAVSSMVSIRLRDVAGALLQEDKSVSWVRIASAAGDSVVTFIDSSDAKFYHAVRTGLLVTPARLS